MASMVPDVVRPSMSTSPSWSTPREALRVAFLRSTVRRTLVIASIVGTILSLINQLGVILAGDANYVTWIRVGANYLVPFCVSTTGYLTATKRSKS